MKVYPGDRVDILTNSIRNSGNKPLIFVRVLFKSSVGVNEKI